MATIYTASQYAFGVVRDFRILRKNGKFLTATWKAEAYHKVTADSLDAVILPAQLAMCKIHANNTDSVPTRIAKFAASLTTYSLQMMSTNITTPETPTVDLKELQSICGPCWSSPAMDPQFGGCLLSTTTTQSAGQARDTAKGAKH